MGVKWTNVHRFYVKVLAMILAGGAGTRLEPLTRERKPEARRPFRGRYRIIDFALSTSPAPGVCRVKD